MANRELTNGERASFALEKSLGALRWIVASGVATFFLMGLLDMIAQLELPNWAVLPLYLVINTGIFAIAKFKEGQD